MTGSYKSLNLYSRFYLIDWDTRPEASVLSNGGCCWTVLLWGLTGPRPKSSYCSLKSLSALGTSVACLSKSSLTSRYCPPYAPATGAYLAPLSSSIDWALDNRFLLSPLFSYSKEGYFIVSKSLTRDELFALLRLIYWEWQHKFRFQISNLNVTYPREYAHFILLIWFWKF